MPLTVNEPHHHRIKRHYTVRKSPYLVSLVLLLAATSLTLLNIYVRNCDIALSWCQVLSKIDV